jgi:hypothetical protein
MLGGPASCGPPLLLLLPLLLPLVLPELPPLVPPDPLLLPLVLPPLPLPELDGGLVPEEQETPEQRTTAISAPSAAPIATRNFEIRILITSWTRAHRAADARNDRRRRQGPRAGSPSTTWP